MKPNLTFTAGSVLATAGIVGVFLLIVWLYLNRDRLLIGAKQAASLVNPADSNNLANRAVTAATSAATGRDETLGGFLFDFFHTANDKIGLMKQGAAPYRPNPLPGYDRSGGPAYG
jgi:hypothetical protein